MSPVLNEQSRRRFVALEAQALGRGGVSKPDLRLRISYQDFVDIVGERLDPLRAIGTGRLRPKGSPLALRKLTKVFPRA